MANSPTIKVAGAMLSYEEFEDRMVRLSETLYPAICKLCPAGEPVLTNDVIEGVFKAAGYPQLGRTVSAQLKAYTLKVDDEDSSGDFAEVLLNGPLKDWPTDQFDELMQELMGHSDEPEQEAVAPPANPAAQLMAAA